MFTRMSVCRVRWVCVAVLVSAAGAGYLARADDRSGSEAPARDELAKATAERTAKIRAVAVEEVFSRWSSSSEAQEARARSRLEGAIAAHMGGLIESAELDGADQRVISALEATHAERIASIDGALAVSRLNRLGVKCRRTSTIDFARGKARYEDRDLRDLDRLVADRRFTPAERQALDQSGTLITSTDNHGVRLLPHVGRLAVVGAGPRFDQEMELTKFGVAPRWVFVSASDTEVRPVPDKAGGCVELVGYRDKRISFVVVWRRDLDWSMTGFTAFNTDGAVAEEFCASDFRQVDGVWIPFQTSTRRTRNRLSDWYVEERAVERVVLNPDLAGKGGLFDIPGEYRVQDLTKGKRAGEGAP